MQTQLIKLSNGQFVATDLICGIRPFIPDEYNSQWTLYIDVRNGEKSSYTIGLQFDNEGDLQTEKARILRRVLQNHNYLDKELAEVRTAIEKGE